MSIRPARPKRTTQPAPPANPASRDGKGVLQLLREFLFGMVGLEFTEHALEMRGSVENLFMLAILGDTVGLPVMPPYYSLRLLPYVVPHIATWKRRVLREREFTDDHEYHLDGL